MNVREYYLRVQNAIHTAPHVLRSDIRFEEIDTHECYIRGVLTLIGDYELHVAEYVITEPVLARPKYRYHLQDAQGTLIVRWDNAPHHPKISTFPDHRHRKSDVVEPSPSINLDEVLDQILQFI